MVFTTGSIHIRYPLSKLKCEILGYSDDDPELPHVYDSWASRIHPDDYERVMNAVKAHLEEGKVYNVDYRHRHKSGEYRWQNSRGQAIFDQDGNPIRMVGCIRDITESKRVEEALRESERRLRLAVDAAQLGTWDWDIQTGRGNWGGHYYRLFGLTPDSFDVREEAFLERVHPEDREMVQRGLADAAEEDTLPNLEYRIVWPNSEVRWMTAQGQTRRDESGKVVGIVGVVQDITERKQGEEELKESEERFRILFESAPVGIVFASVEGRFIQVNRAFQEILGYPEEELRDKHFKNITHSDDAKESLKMFGELVEGKRSFGVLEKRYRRKDGSFIWCNTTISTIRTADEKLLYSIAMVEDINERKGSEEKLLNYQEQLRSLASQLSIVEEQERQRIATELHDRIGQTLSFCSIKLGNLRESASSTGLAGSVDEIDQLIDQTIEDTQSLTFELSPPVLHELGLEPAVEWLAEQFEKEHGFTPQINYDKSFHPLNNDNAILLFRVVRELLVNVAKHARAKDVNISILRGEGEIKVTVRDDGIGFDPSLLDSQLGRIERFGLFSIRERLDYIGGHLEIESQPGEGTRVRATAPFRIDA